MFELLFTHPLWAYRAGKFGFASGWSRAWLIALIVVACVLIVGSLWRRRFLKVPRLLLLGGLQVALAALVLCLIWRPVLTVERVRDRQNVLAIVLDNSQSMANQDTVNAADNDHITRLQQAIKAFDNGPFAKLAKTFELRFFAFDKTIAPLETSSESPLHLVDALPPPGSQTRIGDALLNVMQTAGSVPLAGVVLVSDGGENAHSLSEAALRTLASYDVPVHTVGVGPERIDNDLELTIVELPATAAPGSTVTADLTVQHSGDATTRLRVYDGDTLLAAKEIKLSAHGKNTAVTTLRVEFPSGQAGVRDLRFTLDPLPGERNQVNNTQRQALNVPDTRRSILYIEGEPRWEFKFVRRAIEGEHSLRLASVVRTTQNKLYRQGVSSSEELSGGLPTTAKELFAYDAVIIGSYEAPAFTPAQHELLKEFVDRRGGSVLFLAGRSGLADGGWGNAAIAQALPIHLPTKRGNDFVQIPIKAELTRYGVESTMLRFDADPKTNGELWQSLPELANYQRLGALKPGAVVLLEGAIKNERAPLLVMQRYGRGSVYVLATASTQRWQMSLPVEDQRHEFFWRQIMHALADSAPPRAEISTDRMNYADERNVHIDVQLYDDNYQHSAALVNDKQSSKPSSKPSSKDGKQQMELSITPEQGPSFVQAMHASTTDAGHYTASVDALKTGLYKADITARFQEGNDSDRVVSAITAFRRDDNIVEHFGLQQHRSVLERLAAETSGRYWRLDQLDELTAAIPYTKSGIVERQVLDLWNIPFAFLLLGILKLSEWLLRLKWGTL